MIQGIVLIRIYVVVVENNSYNSKRFTTIYQNVYKVFCKCKQFIFLKCMYSNSFFLEYTESKRKFSKSVLKYYILLLHTGSREKNVITQNT